MAAQGLAWLSQEDFAAGAVRSIARHLIPPSGVYSIENGLLDADGSIYRRGGSEYLSAAEFGTGGLRWVWDGHLAAGQRTVFATPDDFGVLNDTTPVNLGGAGLSAPVRAVVVGGMLFIPGGAIYGGSLKAADYSTGTLSVTQGSAVVTGAGTAFGANVDAGMLLRVAGTGRYYVVHSVDSDTQITLADDFEGATAAGQAYALTRLGSAASPYRQADIYATVSERLVTGEAERVYFSGGRNELGVLQSHVFADTDFHELPEGARVLGLEAIRDLLVVFATDGIWTVNNMPFDLTDAAGNVQQSMHRTSQDVVLWGPAGVAQFRGALVVPATDGVYLVDGVSQPVSVSESITPLLVAHVRAGRKPGGAAVFKGHYFLPVLDSSNLVVDLLVCRLDRPARVRNQTFFPWSWFTGHGGNVAALAQQVSSGAARQPELLAAGRGDGRVLKLTGVFAPSELRKADADGSVHRWLLETRDYPTGRGNVNTVRRVRTRYELEGADVGRLSDARNLVTNPSFEGAAAVSFDFPYAVPDGWAVDLSDVVIGARVTSWSSAGDASYLAETVAGEFFQLQQEFAVAPGDQIAFGFTRKVVSASGDASCMMLVDFLDAGDVVIGRGIAGWPGALVAGLVDSPEGLVAAPPATVSCRVVLNWDGDVRAYVDAVWVGLAAYVGRGTPQIAGFYSVGEAVSNASRWGQFKWGTGRWGDASLEEFTALSGTAPTDDGRARHSWFLAAAARYLRVRLESTDPAARLILRSLEVAIRPSAKDR
jgi:hypothetical protein